MHIFGKYLKYHTRLIINNPLEKSGKKPVQNSLLFLQMLYNTSEFYEAYNIIPTLQKRVKSYGTGFDQRKTAQTDYEVCVADIYRQRIPTALQYGRHDYRRQYAG